MIDQPEPSDVVASAADSWLRTELADVPDSELREIQDLLHHDRELDSYDAHARAFARAFHMVNYRKCLAALRELCPSRTDHIVDLGCGSGAAAMAAMAYLASTGHQGPLTVTLVDKSSSQLLLAETILRLMGEVLKVDLKIESSLLNLPDPSQVPGTGGGRLVLAAHILTENSQSTSTLLKLAEQWAGPGGDVVVVERSDDTIWKRIDEHVAESLAIRVRGGDRVAAVSVEGQRRDWPTGWQMLSRTPHVMIEEAARRYFDAWQRQEPKLLVEVFTENALYHDKPPLPPQVGLRGIESYWIKHVVPQKELSINFKSAQYSRSAANIEWVARFVHDGLQRVLHGIMVLDVQTSSGLIFELREYYRSVPRRQ